MYILILVQFMNADEFEWMWKEGVLVYYEVFHQHLRRSNRRAARVSENTQLRKGQK